MEFATTPKPASNEHILFVLAESLRIIAILISPVLPKAANGIFDQLNWKNGVERKGRAALARRCGVEDIAGWARRRKTGAIISAD
jgi:methionyl-tRNA synthetase